MGEATLDAPRTDHHREWKGRISLKKRAALAPSAPIRLEGLAAFVLVLVVIIFLYTSGRTLFVFPVPDSYRWYGDETQTWMLLGWKNLLAHGKLTVPIALGSTLEHTPGLLLGSPWISAILYGLPQVLFSAEVDPITIGRTVTFILALATIWVIAWGSYRRKLPLLGTLLSISILVTSRSFTFASHSARYDMITGFAVLLFIAIYWLNAFHQRQRGPRFMFVLGFVTCLAMLGISPHLEVLLILPALLIAWFFGGFNRIANIVALVVGAALSFAMVAGIYMAMNETLSITGTLTQDNQAAAYISHLPITHPFSWSAQSHQLWAKGFYLWDEARAFVLVLSLLVVSSVALVALRRMRGELLFITLALALVLIDAIMLQSTLPYYLIHVLPLAALALCIHVDAWKHLAWVKPAIAVASLALAAQIVFIALPELVNAGRIGRKIDEANITAVQAAIEQESRSWQDTVKPLVLAQGPSVHELLRDTTIRVMTESFIFFPQQQELPDSTIAREGVNYILDYDHPMTPEYERAVHKATPIFSRVGPFLDRTVNYFRDTTSEIDTLTLYQIGTNE